ncbi:MAG TPA: HAD hydrolase-like protein [Thermoanaerobaculia bacterium]|nr:HAD hydrolase-like protein [Thermoanaerobaculia bacterium]
MARRLVLFDIDGTLITDGGASRGSFKHALEAVYGYAGDLSVYDFSGRTDPQIARMVLRDAGFTDDAITAKLDELWSVYLKGLAANATRERVRALPGIRELVDALHEHDDVTLALLTGNIEPGARLKLASPELNEYFPFGAFGSDSPRREELPPFAVERASAIDGYRFEGADVVIIGDSIYDVRCGVPYDATTIAVASGKTPADKLRAENPKHFFESAEDLDGMLKAILSRA